MNSCLRSGCPYFFTSRISSTGTISKSLWVCNRRARWRAVAVFPDPAPPPIIVEIVCNWTLSKMFLKLWISWKGRSSFHQNSNRFLSCARKQKCHILQMFISVYIKVNCVPPYFSPFAHNCPFPCSISGDSVKWYNDHILCYFSYKLKELTPFHYYKTLNDLTMETRKKYLHCKLANFHRFSL